MAPFLTKLFQIVSAAATDACIKWTIKGDSFVISDPDTFAREILPTYFKHNNIRSFIRQLNTYGFRKRTNISSTDEHLEFFHVSFRRDEPGQLTQIKRCHQPKAQSQHGGAPGPGPAVSAPQMEELAKSGQMSADLDTIRNRVTELKTRLGSLQMEIRDYNVQMEQKVGLLMQILQTTSPGAGASQLQQQIARMQMNMGGNGSQSTPPSSFGMEHSAGGLGNSYSQPHGDLGRRDSLLASLGHQHGMGGMGGSIPGLGNLSGIGGMSGLGGGNSLSGLGGVLGSGMGGGLGAGMGGFGGMGGLGGFGGMGGLGAVGQKNGGADGGVAGLQHLLEAAQRYHTEDTADTNGRGGSERAAKRFCTESNSSAAAARA
uniref:HSF-type DNA-binding domain-containing protein n=1 Tax=Prymnesium polylepis TaxID=72548 RepID=A0A7S4N0M2_9EUKA